MSKLLKAIAEWHAVPEDAQREALSFLAQGASLDAFRKALAVLVAATKLSTNGDEDE